MLEHLCEILWPFGCSQKSLNAPWVSSLQSSCAVVGPGNLLCVDPSTESMYTFPLKPEEQLKVTQIPLQVSLYSPHVSCLLLSFVLLLFCSILRISCFSFQTAGLEVASGFQPRLVSTQPNPARPPLPEFFLQLGPDRHALLQLNDGTLTLLRDFNPVRCSHLKYISM